MSKPSFSGEKEQLSLDIRQPKEKISSIPVSNDPSLLQPIKPFSDKIFYSKTYRIDPRAKWLELAAVISASILLFIAMLPESNDSKPINENFIGVHLEPVSPIQRKLPIMQPAKTSTFFQVGLFRQLSGAESKQNELTDLGLSPGVIKKVTGDGIMYALVISPKTEAERKSAIDILKANNINYFKAKKNGS